MAARGGSENVSRNPGRATARRRVPSARSSIHSGRSRRGPAASEGTNRRGHLFGERTSAWRHRVDRPSLESRPREIDTDDPEHAGPLHFAAFHGHREFAQLLVESGADLHATSFFGEKEATPVTIAAWEGDLKSLNTILDAAKTANINLELNPALFSALAHGAQDKADLLMKYGAEHDIFTAVMAGDVEVLERCITTNPIRSTGATKNTTGLRWNRR